MNEPGGATTSPRGASTAATKSLVDVFPDEPGSGTAAWHSLLAAHPRVVGTHHIGASTEQAQEAVVDGVEEIISAFERGELVNVVNNAPQGPVQQIAETQATR